MALPSAIKLFIDPKLGLAFGNFAGSSQISNPTFTLGDTAGIEIYLVESTQVASYPRQEISFPATPGIKVAIGAIDESPLAGTWVISYGGNSTSALPYNATAAQLQTALNALASITAAGGVTVSKIGENYNIAFNLPGVRTEITTDGSALIPLSQATVATLQAGSLTKPQISLVHLQRTVAGLATSFTQTSVSQITVDALAAWNGSAATYRVSISPDPKGGSFTLAFDASTGTDVSTASILVGASGQDVFNALNINALDGKVSVTQVGAYAYDITVNVEPGTNGLTANDAGVLSFSGYVGNLSLNTAEAISLLDGAEFVETTLEVEITSDSKTLTLLQIPCTLQNAVIDAGSVEPLVLDTYLSQVTADGRYLRQSNNLSDLANTSTARTNLSVYSTSQVDTALALKADSSHSHIIGDVNGLQTALDGKAALSGAAFTGDVTTTGRMGIGGGVANNTAHKLAIYDGNIVFSNGFGLAFGDGTTQTTAATTPDLSAYATKVAPTLSGGVIIERNPVGTTLKLYDPTSPNFGTDLNNTNIVVRAGDLASFGRLDSQAVQVQAGAGNVASISASGFTVAAGANSLSLNIANGLRINGAEPYARTDGATFTGKLNLASRPSGAAATFNLGAVPDNSAAPGTLIEGDIFLTDIEPLAGNFNTRLNYVGKTFSGSLAAIQVAALNGVSNFFSQTQTIQVTNNTQPALRVIQLGTGDAFRVEDESPETTPFVINNVGKVGIGLTPDGTAALRVDANGIKFGTGNTQTVAFIDAPSDGNYYVRRNGDWVLCTIHTQGGFNYLTV